MLRKVFISGYRSGLGSQLTMLFQLFASLPLSDRFDTRKRVSILFHGRRHNETGHKIILTEI